MRRLLSLLFMLCCTLVYVGLPVYAADNTNIDINQASITKTPEGYRLSTQYDFQLNSGLENALHRGIPLYFTTEVRILRPRWYWFDENSATITRVTRLSYNVLTREYQVAPQGGLQQNFSTLEEAMLLVKRPPRWIFVKTDQLQEGEEYTAAVRMLLDVSQLPKPFQIHVINNRDWRLSSDWKRFTFTA